jgi:hypothetical protein
MKRCHNPRDVRFQHYGGRDIKVCVRWRRSFAAFLADMGHRPSPKHLKAGRGVQPLPYGRLSTLPFVAVQDLGEAKAQAPTKAKLRPPDRGR